MADGLSLNKRALEKPFETRPQDVVLGVSIREFFQVLSGFVEYYKYFSKKRNISSIL